MRKIAGGTVATGDDHAQVDRELPVAERVAFRQIATIYENTPEPVAGGLVYSVMVGFVMWGAAPHAVVLIWTLLRVALGLFRIRETRRFAGDERRAQNAGRWRARYTLLMFLEGLSWSAMSLIFLPHAEGMVSTLIFASVLCIAGVGVFTLASHYPSAVLFVSTLLVPVALQHGWTGGPSAWFVVAGLVVYAGVLLREAKRADRRWAEMTRLRLENAQIAAQREDALRQAEHASTAKSAFLATMSHEIRTPLNGMIGLTELILQSDIESRNRRYLELSLQSSSHLLRLVDEVLDMSKIQAGGITLAPAPFDLVQLLEELETLFMARASAKGLDLTTQLDRRVPRRLVGDAMRLRQVLANLLGNAVKFTDAGRVQLRVEAFGVASGGPPAAPRHRLRFSVSDTGPGIPEDQRQAVFMAFTQADSSTARRHGGTGLGLTISAGLVELMGSRIDLASQVGEGSTFSFEIELAAAPEPSATPQEPAPRPPRAPRGSLAGLRVLLCEDNDVNALIATLALENEGAGVVRVATGRAGVEAAQTGGFDLVLMDVQMPDMDGLQATRHIRSWERRLGRRPLPILALTANAMPADRDDCVAAGMNEFLTKPIGPAALVEALHRAIADAAVESSAAAATAPA